MGTEAGATLRIKCLSLGPPISLPVQREGCTPLLVTPIPIVPFQMWVWLLPRGALQHPAMALGCPMPVSVSLSQIAPPHIPGCKRDAECPANGTGRVPCTLLGDSGWPCPGVGAAGRKMMSSVVFKLLRGDGP